MARTVSNSNSKYKSKYIPGLLCYGYFRRLLGRPRDGGPALLEVRSAPACVVRGSRDPARPRGGVGENVCVGGGSPNLVPLDGTTSLPLVGAEEWPPKPSLKAPPCKTRTVMPRPMLDSFNDTEQRWVDGSAQKQGQPLLRGPLPQAGLAGAVGISSHGPHGFHP